MPTESIAMPKIEAALIAGLLLVAPCIAEAQTQTCAAAKYSDSHFHLANYVQEGIRLEDYLKMMGTAVCRSTVFGIPLQQMWQYGNTGDFAPTYYLQTDTPRAGAAGPPQKAAATAGGHHLSNGP